jgi:hypothetical protein
LGGARAKEDDMVVINTNDIVLYNVSGSWKDLNLAHCEINVHAPPK